MTVQSVNPATEELLARFDEANPPDIERGLERADSAFRSWRRTSFDVRRTLLENVAAYLRDNRERLSRLITLEMGKPIAEAEAEIEKCAWTCVYVASQAQNWLAPVDVSTGARSSYVAFEPLGAILAIMPWNFPFWQVFRFAAPALMAGNTAIVKHAPNVPQCALAIEEAFRSAGAPDGVYESLFIPIPLVGDVIEDARVRAVTVTGSVPTGAAVAAQAGKAIKKSVLELGGSDPFIVLADADVREAAETAVRARNQNAGQSCIAAKRFIVIDSVAEEFEQRLAGAVAALRMGDPMRRETAIGPLARLDLREHLAQQVDESVRRGARAVTGGSAAAGRGFYYLPTVLSDVTAGMPVAREETFGPAAAILRVKDEAGAILVANNTIYGLGASIWTRDLDRARRLARDIEAGSVFVNAIVASDPRLPFGGSKRSGYGRELSAFGMREFVDVQTVWMRLPGDPAGPQPVTPAG